MMNNPNLTLKEKGDPRSPCTLMCIESDSPDAYATAITIGFVGLESIFTY